MAETIIKEVMISKERPSHSSMDYALLREEGIRHIQNLASSTWTDHNIHDPGITILEMLAYAITDLGARANQSIKDLLASKPGALSTEKDFFSAAEILPCGPVTLIDFRKVLIDHNKVRNAWLTKAEASEQIFYLDRAAKQLSYSDGDRIFINGLYQVVLEFEEDELLGDLNSSIITSEIEISPGNTKTFQVAFPFWDEISASWRSEVTLVSITLQDILPGVKLKPLGTTNQDFFAVMDVTYNGTLTDQIGVFIRVVDGVDTAAVELPLIAAKLQDITPSSLIKQYNQKIIAANKILADVSSYLHDRRNLCEDFYSFKTSRIQEIAINATLQMAPEADVEQLLAEIFYSIDKFLSPPIRFYTLDEMLGKNFTADDIFQGPLLKNGFLDMDELDDQKRGNIIYTSDLIRIIMSLNDNDEMNNPGYSSLGKLIIAVQDLTISNFINNQKITPNVRNCLSLTLIDIYKPKLSIDKSLIKVFKDSTEVSFDIDAVVSAFNILKEKDKPKELEESFDFAIPVGENLSVQEYYSIQNDFPLTYGINAYGLPRSATPSRKAQAKQLKGFLLFFEQILADYLSQLAHVKDLFSINAGVNSTYFSQPLTSVPDVSPLLTPTYFTTLPALLNALEQPSPGVNRRNNFLDHLLAQFGEELIDLALLIYLKFGDPGINALIANKADFLKEYATISYNRARSFNIYGRNRREFFTILPSGSQFVWNLKNETGNELLVNETPSASEGAANGVIDSVMKWGKLRPRYQIDTLASGKKVIKLSDPTPVLMAKSNKEFNTNGEAEEEISKIIYFLTDAWNGDNVAWLKRRICRLLAINEYREKDLASAVDEGFHIIEHILLRPKVNNTLAAKIDKFLMVKLDDDGNIIEGKKDPYSFRLTFVFPEWVPRFADADFRRYIEKIVQRETPAHMLAEIVWLNQADMGTFETAFKAWLISSTIETDPELLTDVKNDLIDVMNSW